MKRSLAALVLLASFSLTPSCVGCWQPKALDSQNALLVKSTGDFPSAEVEILVDDDGIPHVYANDEADLSYGLGYMHGRERLWQIMFNKFASQGRLTELIGEDLLDADRFLRLMSYAADRQLAALNARELDLVNAYCDGVNQAAAEYGATAEMTITGSTWEELTPYDVVTITLLFVDQQSPSIRNELGRNRIKTRIDADDPRFALLYKTADSGGVPIVTHENHTGVQAALIDVPKQAPLPLRQNEKSHTKMAAMNPPLKKENQREAKPLTQEVLAMLNGMHESKGASNTWLISGEHTASGRPILANDPHIPHVAPGFFYLAHLESEDFQSTGVTFPGIPAVLIGNGKDIAWGMTNANVDCQDLVEITEADESGDTYLLDGEAVPYEKITQTYKLGKDEGAEVFEEEWKVTTVGPLLPPGRRFQFDDDQELAYMWCNNKYVDEFDEFYTPFWDVAKADTIEEVDAAMDGFPGPPINMSIALTNGDIAYRLIGRIPNRLSEELPIGPRDGRFSNADWGELAPYDQHPQVTNPESGYIMTANQRVVEDDGPLVGAVGNEGHIPYRAQRLTLLLEEMISSGGITAQQALDLQRDIVNPESEFLTPMFAAHCPQTMKDQPVQRVQWFCDALKDFDHVFDTESIGALPYVMIADEFIRVVLETHLGGEEGITEVVGIPSTRYEIQKEAVREFNGGRSILFDDPSQEGREGVAHFVRLAAKRALDKIMNEHGSTPDDWRWGKVHVAIFKGRLSAAPVVGSWFETSPHEVGGCDTCISAEGGGFPVSYGSGYRLIAEMTDTPSVRQITDTGQSGHFGSDHVEDFTPRWKTFDPIDIPRTREGVNARLEGSVMISPR